MGGAADRIVGSPVATCLVGVRRSGLAAERADAQAVAALWLPLFERRRQPAGRTERHLLSGAGGDTAVRQVSVLQHDEPEGYVRLVRRSSEPEGHDPIGGARTASRER